MTAVETEVVDATVVDDRPEPMETHVALERRPPPTREVLMPLDVDKVVEGMEAYQAMLPRLLNEKDYQQAEQGKRFVKKSGWRKIARAFNLSTEIVSVRVERDEHGDVTRAEAIVRAIAPNGLTSDGDGYCSVDEKRFERNKKKLENDLRTTATTRAKNRAISDMVGMGEVSADEIVIDADIPQAHPWGEQADQALGEKAFRALAFLLDGSTEGARTVWDKILTDSAPDVDRRFFPKAAARALLHAAVVLRDATSEPETYTPQSSEEAEYIAESDAKATDFDPVKGTLTGEATQEPPTQAEQIAHEVYGEDTA